MGRRPASTSPRTLVVFVQDKSGSMSNRRDATVSGYNEYLDTLRDEAEGEVLITLTQFNHGVHPVFASKPLSAIQAMGNKDYVPSGMTALYDAVGVAVRNTELQARKNDKVVVVIMTDGEENHSREYNHATVLELLGQKRTDGWEFIFLGAGEEAWATGQSLGFTWQNSVNYGTDDHSHKAAFNEVALANVAVTRGVTAASYLSTSPSKVALETAAGYVSPQATTSPFINTSGVTLDADGNIVVKS